jgi:hypothetical protein
MAVVILLQEEQAQLIDWIATSLLFGLKRMTKYIINSMCALPPPFAFLLLAKVFPTYPHL